MTSTLSGYAGSSIDELPTLWEGFAKLVRADTRDQNRFDAEAA